MPTFTATGYRWIGLTTYNSPVTITITDDDPTMDWFGTDLNQAVTTSDGLYTNQFASGGGTLNTSIDTNGDGISDGVEPLAFFLVGSHYYFIPMPGSAFEPGDRLLSFVGSWVGGNLGWDYWNAAPCFAKGTLIDIGLGFAPIETLAKGDLVWTRDAGLQEIRWLGCSTLAGDSKNAPIVISKGALGNDRDVMLSPNHAVLLQDWRAELYLGEPQALVRAKDLVNGDTIYRRPQPQITYYHLMLDQHHILRSSGLLSESFFPGDTADGMLSPQARAELTAVLSGTPGFGECHSPVARGFEAHAMPVLA